MYRDACRMDDAGPKVVQFLDRVRDQNANPTSPLNRYIEGWAQADLEKILDATAPSYRFTDPFVGSFDGPSLHTTSTWRPTYCAALWPWADPSRMRRRNGRSRHAS